MKSHLLLPSKLCDLYFKQRKTADLETFWIKKQTYRRGNAIHEECQDKLVANDRKSIKTYAVFQKCWDLMDSYKQTLEKAR